MHHNSRALTIQDLIGLSINKSLGLNKTAKVTEFSVYMNQWSYEDLKEFNQTQSELSKVDAIAWKSK